MQVGPFPRGLVVDKRCTPGTSRSIRVCADRTVRYADHCDVDHQPTCIVGRGAGNGKGSRGRRLPPEDVVDETYKFHTGDSHSSDISKIIRSAGV